MKYSIKPYLSSGGGEGNFETIVKKYLIIKRLGGEKGGVRNVSFSENFAYVPIGWSLNGYFSSKKVKPKRFKQM